ncbi:MAG TPA: serine hydrolase domain-containing protein, partial [Acidobacteriaceae bacterium]|nr:serine hydrolase domain-containing protein [Acidobacteriaceae bacterium]
MDTKSFRLILGGLMVIASAVGWAVTQPSRRPGTIPVAQTIDQSRVQGIAATESASFDPRDVSSFLDGLVPTQLVRGDMAGVAVIVIRNGQVLAKKGYGFADVSRKIPIDPDQTVFRVASISKLMTYVSAMQLVEQGRLDLDADVNRYLDFKIEPAFQKPVTLRELMTHTAGFEHQQQYILQHETDAHIPLREFLMRFQPKRIYPPRTIASYSDYGVGLTGYIVEHVSGERFEDYVQHHIFDPLGMAHSTFEQPVRPDLRNLVSQGYNSTADAPYPFEVYNPAPAGGLSTTLSDLALFSQTMLNGGEWNGHRILRPETVQEMWTRQFAVSPALPAMCMGFYEVDFNGLRLIGHAGDTRVFHSQLEIQPELKLIVLSAYNSTGADGSGADGARWEILGGILDRYFPNHEQPHWQPVDARARQIEGTFIKARRMESGRMKLESLMHQIHVHVNADGELINKMAVDTRGHPIKLRYIGNDLWQDEIGQGRIMALRDQSGRVIGFASMFGATMTVRVPWWENARFVLPFLAFALLASGLVACSLLLQILPGLFDRLRTGMGLAGEPLTGTQRLAALVWIPAVPMLLALFLHIAHEPLPEFEHVPFYFLLQNILVAVAIVLSIPGIVFAIRVALRAETPLRTKLKHTAVGVSYVFLIWFSLHWHLIGP